jgi:Pyruvate/2-oxoacid:ferredoxin oxidoreductase gamma subunit
MNEPSVAKFIGRIKKKGLLFINSSLAASPKNKEVRLYEYPFTQTAVELGNIRVANMVALGLYLSRQNTVSVESVLATIEQVAPTGRKDLIDINHAALRAGYAHK